MKNGSAFYGEDERPPLYNALATLYALTGSADCVVELVQAADKVERACEGAAIPLWLPGWCFDGSL